MPLNSLEIFTLIDETATLITEAVERQETITGTTGEFDQQIIDIKNFITERITWLSNELTDTSLCDNVSTPPLVISKINYHPLVDAALNSDDFEFIEIRNVTINNIKDFF